MKSPSGGQAGRSHFAIPFAPARLNVSLHPVRVFSESNSTNEVIPRYSTQKLRGSCATTWPSLPPPV
eukprot:scaffold16309_cov116-Skeletonema_marinoi.AAC.2